MKDKERQRLLSGEANIKTPELGGANFSPSPTCVSEGDANTLSQKTNHAKTSYRRIAGNTLMLYVRLLVVMAVRLYTVRVTLDLLGETDYGIYNVVGGVVAMFSFVESALTTASQRYFSIELAKGNLKRLGQWMCTNITAFSLLILCAVVLAETVGLWFVNTRMTIPAERLTAANVVYQFSILAFCVKFFSIPYNALIVAHEKMSAFAYISIVEALLSLAVVYLLRLATWDRLMVYSMLTFIVSLCIASAYVIYDRRHFAESRFHFYWNLKDIRELLGFSGWHFYGTLSMAVRSHGINILLNLFFNPVVNAARAVAFQIYHAVSHFSGNFFTAVKPQIYKSYAAGENEAMQLLVLRSTVMSSLLTSVLVFPILANTPYLLGVWLKEVPEYTVIFTQLVLVNGLIDCTNGPTIAAALATGKIRRYQLIVGTLIMLNLPLSYTALQLGAEPQATMMISILLSLVTALIRAWLLRSMLGFSFMRYLLMFARLVAASLLIAAIIYITMYNRADSLLAFFGCSALAALLTIAVYLVVAFSRNDVKAIIKMIRKKKR